MADEPSDACSRTDEDGAKGGRNNKRKSTQACSYPNKKQERYVICAFAAVALLLIYLLIEQDEDEDEEDKDEDEEEERANLLKVVVDGFTAIKACAERELGPGNRYIEQILGMLRIIPGYDEAVYERSLAKQEAIKGKRTP